LEIVNYRPSIHGSAVERFNAKLAAGGSEFYFPTTEPKPTGTDGSVWFEHFVATEDGEVYGGYFLKHQTFFIGDRAVSLDNLQLPLSLGLVDNRFAHVSAALLFDALGRNELLYCLGMGSQDSKLVKLLTAAGWRHQVVPFYFRIRSANRFARHIRLPDERVWLRRALRVAGALRIAGVAHGLLEMFRGSKRVAPAVSGFVPRFDSFADDLIAENVAAYALVGDRRAEALNSWYPEDNSIYQRLLVKDSGKGIGWAVVLDTQMKDHKYFGDLRVGTLADGFAQAGHAGAVVAAADRFLSERGVDLIVSNQLHPEWCTALSDVGYRRGPSNFFFYYSGELAELLDMQPDWERRLHINRGDGDGPIHL
jgi:hypothetical protein